MKTKQPSLLQQSALGWVSLACWLCATALVQRSNGQTIQYAFTNFAGLPGGPGSADGVGTDARFYRPSAVAVDAVGNLYVADAANNTIRKVTPAGVVTTVAGRPPIAGENCEGVNGVGSEARFCLRPNPYWWTRGIAVDSAGQVYVADYGGIRKITPEGVVSTFAGTESPVIAVENVGVIAVVYVRFGWLPALGDTISRITAEPIATGVVTVRTEFYAGPGHVISAIAADNAGNVFVADHLTIKKVTAAGEVTTLAGTSITNKWGDSIPDHADGVGSAARFGSLTSMCVDGQGNIFAADYYYGPTIRKITPEGKVTTVAGGLGVGHADIGPAALFGYEDLGIAIDKAGNLYVADFWNNRISKGTPILVPEPRFSSVSVNGGAVTAQVSGLVAGWTIIIESSANLRDWSPIQTNVASGASQTISRPINPGFPAEFLRATMK